MSEESDSWAIKYRPQKVSEFAGQPAAVAVITGWVKTGKIPSAIGFFGPSGCGKTTLAQLTAGLFTGGSSDPTNNPDIQDVPPSERSVAEVRELLQNSRLMPRGGKRRVIIINEAHVYTTEAQKALLSAMEVSKTKTTWMLCTDQPERLQRQLAMRAQPITLSHVSDAEMTKLLFWILDEEKAHLGKSEEAIVKRIVEASYGVPREAVKTLDLVNTAIIGGGKPEDAIKMAIRTGSATDSFDSAIQFIVAILKEDQKAAIKVLNDTGACEGIMHLLPKMLPSLAYIANGGKPKDGLGWVVAKALGFKPDLNNVLFFQTKVCSGLDVMIRSNYAVPAEAILMTMVKR